MKDKEKIRHLYIKQKEEVDALFEEFDKFVDMVKHKEENGSSMLYSEMRECVILWGEYTEAQIALDHITDCEFEIEEE